MVSNGLGFDFISKEKALVSVLPRTNRDGSKEKKVVEILL